MENLYFCIKFDRNVKQIRSLKDKKRFIFVNVLPLYFPTYLVYFLYNILCFSNLMDHAEFLFSFLKILPYFFVF